MAITSISSCYVFCHPVSSQILSILFRIQSNCGIIRIFCASYRNFRFSVSMAGRFKNETFTYKLNTKRFFLFYHSTPLSFLCKTLYVKKKAPLVYIISFPSAIFLGCYLKILKPATCVLSIRVG